MKRQRRDEAVYAKKEKDRYVVTNDSYSIPTTFLWTGLKNKKLELVSSSRLR